MRKYFKNVRVDLIISIVADGLTAAFSSMLIYIQKILFDSIGSGGKVNIFSYMIALAICIGAIILFSYVTMIFSIKGRVRVGKGMRGDFFRAITRYNSEKFHSKQLGEYISIQGNDIKFLANSYLNSVVDLIKSINMFIIYGVIMFVFVNWKMAIIALVLALFSAFVLPKITEEKLSKRNKNYLDDTGRCNAKILDLLYGFKLISSNTRENFNRIFNDTININARMEFLYKCVDAIANALNSTATYLINGIVIIVASVMMYRGEMTIGTAVASIGFTTLFTEPIEVFIYAINGYKASKGIKGKVIDMLEVEPPKVEEKTSFNKEIEFKNVTISYEDFSIENISYNFIKGKKYAIVGGSGSGKSTLMKALIKDVSIDEGKILIDGINIKDIDVNPIISYISQDEHIFQDNFYNNITCFSSYPDTKLKEARNCFKDEFYETIKNNPNSSTLSGGQKGCIKFIRSYLEDKEICIFDEVFAGVDNQTMNGLKEYLLETNKTIIMITHKLVDDLEGFDEVLILDKGKILSGE